jgi:hypothetical protein
MGAGSATAHGCRRRDRPMGAGGATAAYSLSAWLRSGKIVSDVPDLASAVGTDASDEGCG